MIFNTGETSEELKAKYNPEGSVLRNAQFRMLEMLVYLDEVCRKIGVNYSIDCGNVLGAVRHGGFIPWDDDADIALEYNDWKKLTAYLEKNPHPQFVVQTHKTDPGYYGAWSVLRDLKSEYIKDDLRHKKRKLRGLQVDLFPYEKNIMEFPYRVVNKLQYFNARFFEVSHPFVANVVYSLIFKILVPVLRFVSKMKGNNKYYMHSYGASWRDKIPENVFFPFKDIEFEGVVLKGPADPEGYCKAVYKNYMDLPPASHRNDHEATYRVWI